MTYPDLKKKGLTQYEPLLWEFDKTKRMLNCAIVAELPGLSVLDNMV